MAGIGPSMECSQPGGRENWQHGATTAEASQGSRLGPACGVSRSVAGGLDRELRTAKKDKKALVFLSSVPIFS